MYDHNTIEPKIRKFWKDHQIFEKSLEKTRKGKRFVFYEGPPTANGMPHIGHFLTRVYKDLYGRYKTMRGFFVLRKAGWDTHGLPVEIEVEKQLGFTNKKQIEEYGIAKFNRKAKESVWKYKKEWEEMTERMGFWIDLKDPYITYANSYMETVWWMLKEIWNNQRLYQAHKVVPFCTRCGTPLSSHEVAQGYKKVKENSVYLKFKVKGQENMFILAWTTTPWTLPGNVALAVGPEIEYVYVKQGSETYILAKDLIEKVLGQADSIVKTVKGKELAGLSYEGLFKVAELETGTSHKVYEADFVSTTDGTGVVHTAVMYGVDDYNLGTKLELPKHHTVDEQGKFTGVDAELDGRYVKNKETEKIIIERLKKQNNLLKEEEYEHDYPFCWRCGTALLYYAKESWFINMSAVNAQLLENNQQINWVPGHLKEGRFGQWLREAKDWAISRERYWGTPLPIWKCEQCNEVEVVGSVKDLEKRAVGSRNTYYVMRHGYTNRDEANNGITSTKLEKDNYPLTSDGAAQIEEILNKLKVLDEFDHIYTSPFERTVETAQIASKVLHTDYTVDDRLYEIRHGEECEGKPFNLCISHDQAKSFDYREPGGESYNDVRERLCDFMQGLESKHKGKKILIIGHGDPLWLLEKISKAEDEQQIISRHNSVEDWYPSISEFKKLDWRKVPRNELGELDLHRPFVDEIIFKCPKCKGKMKKIPEVIDIWADSGTMPFAQWHYPFENKKIFKNQFPADFIVEAVDQTRGWFYLMLAVSTQLEYGAPYKNVISLGHVLREDGKKMSKSEGTAISPNDIMDRYGSDPGRWYFYSASAPGEPKLFSFKDLETKLKGFIFTLQNSVRFYELYKSSDGDAAIDAKPVTLLDKWLFSRLHRLIKNVGEDLDKYEVTKPARDIESFVVEDLSNWWLRRSRKRKEALIILRHTLVEVSKLLAPFTPFLAEDIYSRLGGDGESVHLADWPKFKDKYINDELEQEMDLVKNIITAGLALRKEKQLRVRQPLAAVRLPTAKKFGKHLDQLIADELNVKKVTYDKNLKEGVELNVELNQELLFEGYARELVRQIQDMRKEAKYRLDEKVFGQWHSDDPSLTSAINQWSEQIKTETLLHDFINQKRGNQAYDVEKEFDIVPGKKIWLGVWKKG